MEGEREERGRKTEEEREVERGEGETDGGTYRRIERDGERERDCNQHLQLG